MISKKGSQKSACLSELVTSPRFLPHFWMLALRNGVNTSSLWYGRAADCIFCFNFRITQPLFPSSINLHITKLNVCFFFPFKHQIMLKNVHYNLCALDNFPIVHFSSFFTWLIVQNLKDFLFIFMKINAPIWEDCTSRLLLTSHYLVIRTLTVFQANAKYYVAAPVSNKLNKLQSTLSLYCPVDNNSRLEQTVESFIILSDLLHRF